MKALLGVALTLGAWAALAQQPSELPIRSELAILDVRARQAREACELDRYEGTREDIQALARRATGPDRERAEAMLRSHVESDEVDWASHCRADPELGQAVRLYEATDWVSLATCDRPRLRSLLAEAREALARATADRDAQRRREEADRYVSESRRLTLRNRLAFLTEAVERFERSNANFDVRCARSVPDAPARITLPEPVRSPDYVDPGVAEAQVNAALAAAEAFRERGDCPAREGTLRRLGAQIETWRRTGEYPDATVQDWRSRAAAAGRIRCAPDPARPRIAALCPATFPPARTTALSCRCPAEPSPGTVWGTYYYSADSNLCAAARHAGLQNSLVIARPVTPQAYFVGTTRNGVISRGTSTAARAITFDGVTDPESRRGLVPLCRMNLAVYSPAQRQSPITCRCLSGSVFFRGAVYGSGPYAGDSNICTAARHAGALTSNDGIVTVTAGPGQERYSPSTRNGVASTYWGAYPLSMTIVAGPD